MKSKVLAATFAALLSISLVAGTPALAQMELDDAVRSQLISLGYTPDDWTMTQEQAIELQNVLSGTDNDDVKRQRIEQIMGDAAAAPVTTTPTESAVAVLEESVKTRLRTLGFMPDDWMLTEQQTIEIQNVLSSTDTDDVKRQRVEQIMGDAIETPETLTPTERALQALDDSVRSQLISLGFQPSDWEITDAQALELQNVISSTDSDQIKQNRVRQIMGMN